MSRSLDVVYFKEKLSLVIKDLGSYAINPADLARLLVRYARVADEQAAIDECGNTKTIDSVERVEMNLNTKNLKPFDLEAALRGEPVMLRDGRKAFVRHHETEVMVGDQWQLWGVIIECCSMFAWAKEGGYDINGDISGLDIIGMYPKTRTINGYEVPAPETEELNESDMYFIASISHTKFYESFEWHHNRTDEIFLERGLVFLTKEDAIASAKAMLGINPYD